MTNSTAASYQHDLHQREPLLYKHIKRIPAEKMAQRQVVLWAVLFYQVRKGLSGRMLPFHYHSHRTHVRFTAVFGMNVLQHCLRGQRAWVSNASVKVLNVLRVCASTTDKGRTSVVSTDAVHNK